MGFDFSVIGVAILGAMTAGAVGALSGALTIRLRRRAYVRANKGVVEVPFVLPVLPSVKRTETEVLEDRAVSLLLRSHHDCSKFLQDRAVGHLVSASATLFVAFASSVAGVTILRAWPAFHVYSACLDVASLAVVIWTFGRSGQLRTAWLRERALSEFIRQWVNAEFLLVRTPGVLTAPYDTLVTRTKEALKCDHLEMTKAVMEFGRVRVAEIHVAIASAPPISKDRLRFYLHRRPIYQANWFAMSEARILSQRERRSQVMAWFFWIALSASIVKLIATLAHAEEPAEWAVLVLMIAIGLGTAATSSYVGQNSRSLGHRYGQQVRAIERWFEDHQEVVALARTDTPMQQGDMAKLARAVVAFEALMLTETVDWIGITQHDSMELSPT